MTSSPEFAIINPMCGRYRLSRRKQLVDEYFGTVSGDDNWIPRYNIAPSQPVVTIRQDAREPVCKLSTMRWGLIPSWAKDPSMGYKTINARAETVATTASFREPFKSQRCLIPADGFYEWRRQGKGETAVLFRGEWRPTVCFRGSLGPMDESAGTGY